MTAQQSYPEYKDSGVDWLGAVPATWGIQPISTIASVRTSNVDKKSYAGERPVQLCNYTDVYYNDVIRSDMPFMTATASDAQVASFTLLPGDTVITKDSETPNDIGLSALVAEPLPEVVCGYHLAVYRPRDKRYGAYIKRLFDSSYLRALLEVSAQGVTRVGLSKAALRGFVVPVPPEDEAARIASFLDHETAEIDAFIADQQELIGLLNERRAATITQTVTKGLDPSVPMKDSGVEWLGAVPEHWDASSISNLRAQGANTFTDGDWIESPYIQDFGVRLIQTGNIGIGKYREKGFRYVSDETFSALNCTEVTPGDLLICRLGDPVGRSCIAPDLGVRMITSVDVCILKVRSGMNSSYVNYVLNSGTFLGWVSSTVRGSTRDRVSRSMLGKFRVPVPSEQEQQQIADHLDRETAKIDAAIADAKEAIELSKERRAALISAAVTGKIDVRDHPAAKGAV